MRKLIRLIGVGLLVVSFSLVTAVPATAAVTVTPASGGEFISADNFASGTWTSLGATTAITIAEGLKTDIAENLASATLVLKAPSGFEFNPAQTPSITGLGGDITDLTIAITSANITVTLSTDSPANKIDTITIGVTTAIQVRPTAGTPLAIGRQIYRPTTGGGTAGAIAGIITTDDPYGSDGTNFGILTEVAGAVYALQIVQQPTTAGAGAVIAPPVTVKAVDQFGNVIAGQSVAASLQVGSGVLSGTTPRLTNASGIATFDDLSINEAGDKVLRFTADSKFVDSDTFTIISVSITITPPTGKTNVFLTPETADQSLITSTGNVTSNVNFDVTAKDSMADSKSGNAGKLIEYDAEGIVPSGKVLTNAVTVWSSHTNKVASEITLTASDQSVISNAASGTGVNLLLIVEQDTAAGDESLTQTGHYYKIVITFTASQAT